MKVGTVFLFAGLFSPVVTDAGKMRRSAPDLSSDGLKRNTAHSHEKVPPYGKPLDYFFLSRAAADSRSFGTCRFCRLYCIPDCGFAVSK
jgi:hypothetical protein